MKIHVVDYGMGNIGSIVRALSRVGASPVIASSSSDLLHASHIVLPGVGNFTGAMRAMQSRTLDDAITASAERGAGVLGICLGMQLLASAGCEGALGGELTLGLGLIPGEVHRLTELDCQLRVPHVGWNEIRKTRDSTLLRGLPDGVDMYYVHSFALPVQADVSVANTEYGTTFMAAAESGRVFGVQFHPEKSSAAGLQVLRNFCDLPC